MIAAFASEILERCGWRWRKSDGSTFQPTEIDVEQALDAAIARLYTSPVGTQLAVGHLLVQKQANGIHDVFVHIGETR